jgi:hypothetical protein
VHAYVLKYLKMCDVEEVVHIYAGAGAKLPVWLQQAAHLDVEQCTTHA